MTVIYMNELDILNEISYIGYLLLKYGAEIYRIEESLERMLKGLGYKDVEVFALPAYFTMSCTLEDHTPYCITKRSLYNRINLDKLYELNNLVRNISNHKVAPKDIHDEIIKIIEKPMSHSLILIGYVLSAAFFTLFFGGKLNDMLVASVNGFILYYAILIMENLQINSIVRTILSSMILTIISLIAFRFDIIQNIEFSIIGTLMILTPGVAITNSFRDIIRGDYESGVARFIEAFLIAASIAIGVGTIMLIGGI